MDKGKELTIENNYLADLLRLYGEELSSTKHLKLIYQKVCNFFMIYNKKTNPMVKYLTNIDKFSIIYYGK